MTVVGFDEKINVLRNKNELFLKLIKLNEYNEEQARSLEYEAINIGDDVFYLIQQDKKNLLEKTSLYTHKIVEIDDEFKRDIKEALKFLKENFKEYYDVVRDNIKYIANLSLKEDNKNIDSTITSCSLPSLPYVIFISYKAGYHIPPSNISGEKNKILLAENIFHEAIHQIVNLNILMKDVLKENYSSITSPKIDIPWRKQQKEERNKAWELDRVLHATSVYANLLPFRKNMLREISEEEFKSFYSEAIESGQKSFNHLLSAIYEKKEYFASDGIRIIDSIKEYYS